MYSNDYFIAQLDARSLTIISESVTEQRHAITHHDILLYVSVLFCRNFKAIGVNRISLGVQVTAFTY